MASGCGDQGVSTCHTSLGGTWWWCRFFLLCNPLGVTFPCLLEPFYTSALSSPVCSSRQHPNLLYKLPFTCVGDFFPFFATPKIPVVEVQVSISLTDRRWVVYSCGVYSCLQLRGLQREAGTPSLVTPCPYSSAPHPTSLLLKASEALPALYFSILL